MSAATEKESIINGIKGDHFMRENLRGGGKLCSKFLNIELTLELSIGASEAENRRFDSIPGAIQ